MFKIYSTQFYYFSYFSIIKIFFVVIIYSANTQAQSYYLPFITEGEKCLSQFIKSSKLRSEISTFTFNDKRDEPYENPMPSGDEYDSLVHEISYGKRGEVLSQINTEYFQEHLHKKDGYTYQYDSLGRRISCYEISFKTYYAPSPPFNSYTPYYATDSLYRDSTLIYHVKYNANNVGSAEWNNKDAGYVNLTKLEYTTDNFFPSSKKCKNSYDKEGHLISSECYTTFDDAGKYIYISKRKVTTNKYSSFSRDFHFYTYY